MRGLPQRSLVNELWALALLAASQSPSNQAATAALRRRRRAAAATRPKPSVIVAQVAGSGTTPARLLYSASLSRKL